MYDFILKLQMKDKRKAIGFRVLLEGQEVAKLLFFEGHIVPETCILQHNEEEFICRDRIEALHILQQRLQDDKR